MSVEVRCLPGAITSCYLIQERGLVLVDAGPPQKGEHILKRLRALSVDPKDIGLIVVTHAHWDHIGALAEWQKLTGAKVAIHQHERDWVEKGLSPQPKILSPWGVMPSMASRMMAPLLHFAGTAVDLALTDDGVSLEPFGLSGRVLHTPGHTRGSMSVSLDAGDAFVGDLAMNGHLMRWGPGLPSLGDDHGTVKASWRLLLEGGARTIYPAHGSPFGADVLRKNL